MKRNLKTSKRESLIIKSAKRQLDTDHLAFMSASKDFARKARSSIRKAKYECLARAVSAISFYIANKTRFQELLNSTDFPNVRTAPKGVHVQVMYYLYGAANKSVREQASREGRAIEFLMQRGVEPENVAQQLSEIGGIRGALEMTRDSQEGEEHKFGDVIDEDQDQDQEERSNDDDDDDDCTDDDSANTESDDTDADTPSEDSRKTEVKCPPTPEGHQLTYTFTLNELANEVHKPGEMVVRLKKRRMPSGFVEIKIVKIIGSQR